MEEGGVGREDAVLLPQQGEKPARGKRISKLNAKTTLCKTIPSVKTAHRKMIFCKKKNTQKTMNMTTYQFLKWHVVKQIQIFAGKNFQSSVTYSHSNCLLL